MLTIFQWLTIAQWLIMSGATILLWRMRETVSETRDQSDLLHRLKESEKEIERLRKWRHEIMVPWQQDLLGVIEEKFVTRREYEARYRDDDTPPPWPGRPERRRK